MGKGHKKGWKKEENKSMARRWFKSKRIGTSLFVAIIALVCNFIIALLQWNGVVMPWQISACAYLVLAGSAVAAFWNWEISTKWPPRKRCGWAVFIAVVLVSVSIWGIATQYRRERITELGRRFPGGFVTFGVLTGGSATAVHTVKSLASYNFDITWDSATITELTPKHLTLQLQNIRIARTETTPSGFMPAGKIEIRGAAIWQIDRGSKLVYINNGMSFWGYVLGGFLISDTDDELIVAIGLQNT